MPQDRNRTEGDKRGGGGGVGGSGLVRVSHGEVPYPQVKFLPLVYTSFDGNVSLSNYTSLNLEKDLIWAEPSSMGRSKEYSLPRDERVIACSRDSTISSSTDNDRCKFNPSKKR